MTAVEHPAVKVRLQALARLRRQFPGRCEADREDAVHEALCAALEHGHADQVRTVSGWAARRLLGFTVDKGVRRPARSQATSIAGWGMVSPEAGEEVDHLAPTDWLDASRAVALTPDPEDALDLAPAVGPMLGREPLPELLRLLAEARGLGVCWADVARACGCASVSTPRRWLAGEAPPTDPEAAAVALDGLLRDHDAAIAEARARARRVEEARREQERREEAARRRALAVFVRRRAATDATPEGQRATREALRGRGLVAVAALLGIGKSTIARWRDGESVPGAEHLRRLREVAASHAHRGAP